MAKKLKYITDLYEEAVQSVTESYESWTAFLRSAARNYKCPFDELLLIYAQRPDATAVLTIEQWNGQFGRWVNRGATGIAVFDGDHNSIKHYFDISDTHPTSRSRRQVPLWEMEEKYAAAVKERLENTFGDLRFTEPFSSVLIAAAENAASDHVQDYFSEFLAVCEDSVLDELSAEELEEIFLKTVKHSIMYMLFARCGEDTELFVPDHFDGLPYFNTPMTVNALGTTVGDISKTVLKEIAAVVLAEMREEQSRTFAKKKESRYDEPKERIQGGTDHEYNIHDAGRLPAPGSADAGTARNNLGQIREDAGTVLKAAPTHPLHESSHDGETEGASGGDGTDREREDRADNGTDGADGGADGTDESGRSHDVDRAYEQPETRSGGTDPDGTHIQLMEEAESQKLPAFLVQENIWAVLKYDRYMKRKRQDIALYFSSHDLDADRRKFVKDSYNMDTYCELLANDARLGYIAREEGLTMWEGNYLTRTSEDTYSWDLVQLFIADMIKSGEYLDGITPIMQKKTKDVERSLKKTQNVTLSDIPSVPLSISQQIIDEVLADGGTKDNSTLRICSFFRQDRGVEENAEFLKDEYGRDGKGFIIDGQRIAMWFDDSGIRIAAGNSAIDTNNVVYLSWEQAARRIRELLDMGRYLPQKDLDRADSYELQMIAEKIWYLDRDCRDGYSILEKQSRRGFPEETAYLAGLLTHREQVEKLRDRIKQFIVDYVEDESILRFRYHRPFELYEYLDGMLGERLIFTSDVESRLAPQLVITQDVIDKALTGGSNISESKMRIYSYFLNNASAKDRESFLRKEYGIGGSSYFSFHEGHDGKGLSISIGSIVQPYDKVLLKWPAVAKRIDELITAGRYMNRKELEYIPEYEKQELAREIRLFFGDKKDCVKPYSIDDKIISITDSLKAQLNDPGRVKEILEMMRTVLDSMTAEDERYEYDKKAYDDLLAFSEGRFSLFGKKEHIPAAIEEVQEDAEYHLRLGATVYLGIREYEIHSFDDKQVTLCDPSTPLLLDVMDRNIFDARLRDNPKNDYLLVADEDTKTEDFAEEVGEGSEILPEIKETEEKVEGTLTPVWEKVKQESYDEQILPQGERHNYRITDDALGAGGAKERFQNNIAAITLLKKVEEERRLALPEEQEILAKYAGWGGLPDAFDETKDNWHSEYEELKELLTEEEYTSARESTLTAFYTPPVVIRAMYTALQNMGLRNANILEPACGTGNFMGMLPAEFADCKIFGVEIDSISGRIAKQLYQNSRIMVTGYENADIPDSFFDAAVGNVPFGQFKVADKRYDKLNYSIHDYYFAKTLDKVRPGGVIAFITSSFTMDKESPAVRRYIAERAEFLGAIRLPNDTFYANAGTRVTSDIIFLKKRDRMVTADEPWLYLGSDRNGILMNAYFAEHPEMIMGEMVMESTRFGYVPACRAKDGQDLSALLSEAIGHIHGEISEVQQELSEEEEDKSIPADPSVRNFSYTIYDGKIYYRENSRMYPQETSVTGENRIKGMIAIRDCVRRLITYQTEEYPDTVIRKEQAELNRRYDDFAAKYGRLSDRANSAVFSSDSSYPLLTSLEIFADGKFDRKADMFFKRTIKPNAKISHVDTASEALAVSLAEKAKVDMEYMSELTGKSEEELYTELKGVIFLNPMYGYSNSHEEKYVTADEYLSGNVRKKLVLAKQRAEQNPEDYTVNVQALEKVQPKDLSAAEIGVRLGSTWVPTEDILQFIYELLDTPRYLRWKIKVHYSKFSGDWNIEGKSADYSNIKAINTYGTNRISAYKIIETTLNLRDVRIYDYLIDDAGRKIPQLNERETAIAQGKQELIKQAFQDWIWKDPNRRQRLTRYYNDTFNANRDRDFDGSHITFPGMNPEIQLRKHQKDAVARTILSGKNSLYAHVVGAGKTFTIVAAAQEMKRLGLCHKSMIVVPNHLTEQWAAEYLQLYPAANILVTTKKDFETQNRKRFCSRIATGDFDAVIIGHSQFEKIPISIERQQKILERQIEDVVDSIAEAKRNNSERFTIKQMEKTKKTLQIKLRKLNSTDRKDDVVTFEELGVDRLFVDEADNYKNLFLYTKMRNVGGIAQTEAQKSSDMYMKCRYMDELTGGCGVIFATGTPVSNSMVELYTMQRYLQYAMLEQRDLQHFDAWASTFGETITAIELAPEGTGYRTKTRFAKFHNLPELMTMFREVADIRTADMLNLPVPKANYRVVAVKPSDIQKDMVADLARRAERVRARMVAAFEDNMLLITNDGRKLALDQRLMNELLPDSEGSKVNACVEETFRHWEQGREDKLTQLLFCDLSTPRKDSFDVYNDVKEKLIAKGVPAEEIAFIHDANAEVQKKELFSKVRRGQVRVLIGSTAKMGAGTNVQDRIIASHDLDCPWRPRDLEQRAGRTIRQGNRNPEVEIIRYVTEGTFDAYLYQLIENKQKFIAQIMTSKSPMRSAEDIDETALSYAEIKALASGNPLIKEKMDLDIEVSRLQLLKSSYLSQKYDLQDKVISSFPRQLQAIKERIAGYLEDMETVKNNTSDDFFPMTLYGTEYTDKKEAGTMLLEACSRMRDPKPTEIGAYRGFTMILSFDIYTREYNISLQGKLTHSTSLGRDVYGNIQRIDNVLAGMEDRLKSCRQQLEDTMQQFETAKVEAEKPFIHEEELAKKSARLSELNTLLNMDKKDNEILCETPEEEPEKQTEEHER